MRARAVSIVALLAVGTAGGCTGGGAGEEPASADQEERVRYVPLGDSYTIGTGVTEPERWPNQLAERIDALELVGNPAVNGYTSADLIRDELPRLEELRPDFVTLLIGVNDVVQGVPDGTYAANVARILDELLVRLRPERIACVATPDYTRTPRGAEYGDPDLQSDRIVRVNAILREACELRGITFVPEVFEISQQAGDDPALVAADGLHPSGEQYRRWVEVIAPAIEVLLAG